MITWIGHATALIELDGVRIMTDPVLRNRVAFLTRHAPPVRNEWLRDIDAVLVSHLHRDHLDLPSLKRLAGQPKVVAPRGSAQFLMNAGFDNVEELGVNDTTWIKDVRITAMLADHSGFRVPFGPSSTAIGYVVEGSRRIYFAGDTGLFREMETVGTPLDIALLPVGGWGLTVGAGHLTPWTATEAVNLLRPRVVVPIHWGTLWTTGLRTMFHGRFSRPGPEFARLVSQHAPMTEVCLTAPGRPVVLPTDF